MVSLDCHHFAVLPSLVVEPCNGSLCVFAGWGPFRYDTDLHNVPRIAQAVHRTSMALCKGFAFYQRLRGQ